MIHIKGELAIKDLDKVPERTLQRAMPEIVKTLTETAKELAPDSGNDHRAMKSGVKNKLRNSIVGKVHNRGESGEVQARAPHAHLIHDGVKSHAIVAPSKIRHTQKKSLRIAEGGNVFLRRSVYHPGIDATPFLTDALEETDRDVERIMEEAGDQALQGVAR